MSPIVIFQLNLVLGYVAWVLCFVAYVLPGLKAMDRVDAERAIATLHSIRFFGLVFLIPGVVGPNLPVAFAVPAASVTSRPESSLSWRNRHSETVTG
jgi:hypothetical protein